MLTNPTRTSHQSCLETSTNTVFIEYDHSKPEPDLFLASTNHHHWEEQYIHPEYNGTRELQFVDGNCWDIYNFPLFSEKFCHDMINWSETTNQWYGPCFSLICNDGGMFRFDTTCLA